MNNEEHTSILEPEEPEFETLFDEYNYMVKILDDEDVSDIPIGSDTLPKEPNLDFSSAAEILSKD